MSDHAGPNIKIHRAAKRRSYTVIDNQILVGGALSLEAIGLLSHLLSRPDNWTISLGQLSSHHRIGRDKTQRIMSELRAAGYARLETIRDAQSGHLSGRVWIINEQPEGVDRLPENTVVGDATESLKNRPSEKPSDGKSDPIISNEDITITDSPQSPPNDCKPREPGPSFDEFERVYPFSNADPAHAKRQFDKLNAKDRRAAVDGALTYVAACKAKGRKVSFPQAYLRSRMWEGASALREGDCVKTRPRPDASALCTIAKGTPEGDAWTEYELATRGKPPNFFWSEGMRKFIVPRRSPFPPSHEPERTNRAFRPTRNSQAPNRPLELTGTTQ